MLCGASMELSWWRVGNWFLIGRDTGKFFGIQLWGIVDEILDAFSGVACFGLMEGKEDDRL
jgi:hypothetical protein